MCNLPFLQLMCLTFFGIGRCANNSIDFNDIKWLMFYKDKFTFARRNDPVPQIQCLVGSAKCSFIPNLVLCDKVATDVQWECKTNKKIDYNFGNIRVICEGYNYPEDPYILKGSCSLHYNVDYANLLDRTISKQQSSRHKFDFMEKKMFALKFIFLSILTVLIVYPLYVLICHCLSDLRTRAVYEPKIFQKSSKSRGHQPRPMYHYDGYQPTNMKTFISMKRQSSDLDQFGNSVSPNEFNGSRPEVSGLKNRLKNKVSPPYPVSPDDLQHIGRPPYPVGFRPEFYPDPIADVGFRPEIFPSLTDYQKASQQQPLYHRCDSFSHDYYLPNIPSSHKVSAQVEPPWSDEYPVNYNNEAAFSKIASSPSAPPLYES